MPQMCPEVATSDGPGLDSSQIRLVRVGVLSLVLDPEQDSSSFVRLPVNLAFFASGGWQQYVF